jgi:hypothetical protein
MINQKRTMELALAARDGDSGALHELLRVTQPDEVK